jgi:uncharacterized surface protein with fasciclin (FAS1) repeats
MSQAQGIQGVGDVEETQIIPFLKSHIAIDGTTFNGDTVHMNMNRYEVTIASTTANIADGPLPESCSGRVEVYSIDNVIIPSTVFDLYFTPVVDRNPAPLVVPSSTTRDGPLSLKGLVDLAGYKCPELTEFISEDAPVLNTALLGKEAVLDNTSDLDDKKLTIFPPTDAPFLAAATKLGFQSVSDADPRQLMDLIKHHIAVSDKDATAVFSLTGEIVTINSDKVAGPFNSANNLAGPLPEACFDIDDVVYSIHGVLLPEEYADADADAPPPDAGPLTVENSSVMRAAVGYVVAIYGSYRSLKK